MVDAISARPAVMVVDDDTDGRELLAELLEGEGYKVVQAKHGQEALEHLNTVEPGIILLDLNMPVMDGREFLGWLQRLRGVSKPVVIVITAQVPAPIPGAEAVLRKPVNIPDLLNLIGQYMAPNTAAGDGHRKSDP